jgi:hypothetical protein
MLPLSLSSIRDDTGAAFVSNPSCSEAAIEESGYKALHE